MNAVVAENLLWQPNVRTDSPGDFIHLRPSALSREEDLTISFFLVRGIRFLFYSILCQGRLYMNEDEGIWEFLSAWWYGEDGVMEIQYKLRLKVACH